MAAIGSALQHPQPREVSAAGPRSGATADRAVVATLACIARGGLAKLTVDDVAAEAGCSRATLYRSFSSKRALVAAAVRSESERIASELVAGVAQAPTLDDAVTDVIVAGARALRDSAALRFVAAHEPEVLEPHLSFAGGDRLYAEAARRIAPAFDRWCDDPERAAEWVVRVGLSLLSSADPPVDVTDRAAVRVYVCTFVTPGISVPPSAVSVLEERS